jgi:hypothetical protein
LGNLPRVIRIDDPTVAPQPTSPLLQSLIDRVLLDRRDWTFVALIAQLSSLIVPAAVLLFVIEPFQWWAGAIYLGVVLFGFLDRLILMVHNVAHRGTFKPGYRFIQGWLEWVLQPLFGLTPHTYFAHHVAMHHPEENGTEDVSSTMRFRRDSFIHFLRYVGRFYFWGFVDMSRYLFSRRRFKVMRRMLTGEVGFWIVTVSLFAWKPGPTLFVLVLPVLITRFLMMAGNWGQHAFIDESDPLNSYKNSITCINCRYNRRAFNDGYHVDHHLKPRQHWTELPVDLKTNPSEFAKNGSIIFEGIDFFIVWAALMLKRYDFLASRYVSADGRERSKEEVMEFLRSRTRPILQSHSVAASDPSDRADELPSPT